MLLVGFACALLGYSQWRRQRIINESAYFEKYGVNILVPNDVLDRIWQRHPSKALVKVPNRLYSPDNEKQNAELLQFGITDVTYEVGEIETDWKDAIDDAPQASTIKQ